LGLKPDAMNGEIVWYSPERAYGFVRPADGGGDIAFRLADASVDLGGVTIGMAVHYMLRHDPIGPLAVRLAPGHLADDGL
jgi:cold shock CspA family protein